MASEGTSMKLSDPGSGLKKELKKIIEGLQYLEVSKRYKENKVYSRASFKSYLDGEFNMHESTYRELVRAYIRHPDETLKFGVGVVRKATQLCGLRAKKAFTKIEKAKTHAQIERIIQKHRNAKVMIK